MRRLPDGGDARSLLEAEALSSDRIDAVARRIARFHRSHRLGRPAPFTPDEWPTDRRIAVESDAPDWRATLFAEPHIVEIT